jgi:hypothetical protein
VTLEDLALQPFSDQCFLLPTTGQSLLLFSLPPTLAHLLPLGLLPPLAVGSLCCHAPASLSAVTTVAARTAAKPIALKTRTMRTDGLVMYWTKFTETRCCATRFCICTAASLS